MTTIQDIARSNQMFPQATSTTKGNTVSIQLNPAHSHSIITLPLADDQYIQQKSINSEIANKVASAFKRFSSKLMTIDELGAKIVRLIQKDRIRSQSSTQASDDTSDPVDMEQIMTEAFAKKAVENEIRCIEKAKDQLLLFFIGKTGAGKSTTTNQVIGRKMKSMTLKELGIIDANTPIIVAEDPVSKIGINPFNSKTSLPEVIPIPPTALSSMGNTTTTKSWAICDCPGFRDTRGPRFEINNSSSIQDTYLASKGIKGFVVFIESSQIMSGKIDDVKDNVKYLQLLMKSFKRYKQSTMFVITKTQPHENLASIRVMLEQKIKRIAQTSQQDKELKLFCEEIVDSEVLKGTCGERIVIGEPLKDQSRIQILNIIINFTSDTTPPKEGVLGYPLSPDGLSQAEIAKLSNKSHARTTLITLKNKLDDYWEKKIAPISKSKQTTAADVQLALTGLTEITDNWLNFSSTKKADLTLFATDSCYVDVSKDDTDHLSRFLSFWNNLNKITSKTEDVNDKDMQVQYDEIVKELQAIRDKIDDTYHQRMHNVNRDTLEKVLQSYGVQSKLENIQKDVDLKNLMQDDIKTLSTILVDLDKATKANLPYLANIASILKKKKRRLELQNLIRLNILETLKIETQNDQILVTAKATKVALSAILPKVSAYGSMTSLVIQAQNTSQTGTIYFDTNMGAKHFANVDWITINADKVLVKGPKRTIDPKVVLPEMGFPIRKAIFIMGSFTGTHTIEGQGLLLSENKQKSSTAIRCVWPL